jgi:preprotein translocase subunit SecD
MRRRNFISLIGIVVVAVGALALTIGLGYAPKLGLDLQGGASVTLLPEGNPSSDSLGQAVQIIRQRVDALGVAEPEITRQGNAIVVNLPGVKDQDRALQLVGQTAELRFRPVLEVLPPDASTPVAAPATTVPAAAGPDVATTAPPADSSIAPATTAAGGGPGNALPLPAQDSPTTVAPTDTTAPTATTAPASATTAPPTATAAPTTATTVLATTTPENDQADQQVVLPELDSNGNVVRRYLLGPAFLTGSAVSGADAVFQNGWQVSLNMKGGANGIDTWNKVTEQCFNGEANCPGIGSRGRGLVAITLDGTVKSAPEIQPDNSAFSPFSADQISISGNFSEKEAGDLALVLKYGALPVKLDPQAVQTVSATLGKDSLRAGVIAGVIGVALVVLFMFAYYRSLGFVVLGGLLISSAILWAVISWLGESRGLALTLAGATGIIVSVGVTVDSYVVYFERLKDDARLGRTFRSSAQRGWASAWRTILAADIVSLIGAVLLWYLTVGSVRGFAFFLGLSTLIDLVVAYFFLRPAVILLSQSRFYRGRTHLFGVTQGEAVPVAQEVGV